MAQASMRRGSKRAASSATQALLHLPTPELLRLGLISNRGMVMVAVLVGALMHNEAGRKLFFNWAGTPPCAGCASS